MLDALATTQSPVIFSHACVKAICNHRRNVPDNVLQKLQQNDGVICITFFPDFVNCTAPASQTSIDQVVAHFVYVKKLIGARHLCIGADFDGITETIPGFSFVFFTYVYLIFFSGLSDVSHYPDLVAALIANGFTDSEVIGVIGSFFFLVFLSLSTQSKTQTGGNVLRVLERNEAVAASLRNLMPGQAVLSNISNNDCRTVY